VLNNVLELVQRQPTSLMAHLVVHPRRAVLESVRSLLSKGVLEVFNSRSSKEVLTHSTLLVDLVRLQVDLSSRANSKARAILRAPNKTSFIPTNPAIKLGIGSDLYDRQ